MKIKMNLKVIQAVEAVDDNTVRGYICDPRAQSPIIRAPIVLTRFMQGWTRYLKITVNNAIIFDGVADDEQRADFEVLMTMARGQKAQRESDARMDTRDMVRAAQLFIDTPEVKFERHVPRRRTQ